ncbi:MAG TPA: tyrosine-type recombinase/integrase [Acidimicrobiia bacterium]|nr:tyrosine-type recombinase/integrase [Acidimicrobiia bacterium]
MATSPWSGLTKAYLGQRVARRALSRRSRQEYAYVLADFASHMEGVPLSADVDDLILAVDAWLTDRKWSIPTCCTHLGIIRPFFDWAAMRRHVAPGVARELRNPRKPRPLPRALNHRQMAALFAVVPDSRGRAIVLLEGQCGLRRTEVATLSLTDVDLVDGAIRVRGKGGKERMVYPSEETIDALRAWLVERGLAPGALICHFAYPGRPLSPTWIGILVANWMRDAGLKTAPRDGISGHALRHTTATQMLRDGARIDVVKEALGHESISTTAGYLRTADSEVKAAMRKLTYSARRLALVPDEQIGLK